ncbi:S8 family serine peptidase [Modestobacter sp. NPDC049651]|uniref:S8 family peptidase n=1 Tax=unclassified Modestobacter TaxID=2643866 RepID=UPI0033C9A0D4
MARRRRLARGGVVAVAAALAATGGTGSAVAAPAGTGTHGTATLTAQQFQQLQDAVAARASTARSGRPAGLPASGPASFFLELATPATAQVYTDTLASGTAAQADRAAQVAKPAVEAAAGRVASQLPAAVPDARVLYTASTVLSGVAVTADAGDYDALTAIPGVSAVHAITPKKVANTGAAAVVQAVQAWQDLGNTGQGVRVGVIDTGIDYTHADFGGSGDVGQYTALTAAEKAPAPAGVFPSTKVVGGYDFVGNDYNADPATTSTAHPYQPVPHGDPNPLDCNGHGSHVSGTAAGYGVSADGSTYRGGYGAGFDADALRIGPGMAPDASLYALKVFGCEGSTDVTVQALEWAMDPDRDGSIADHLDVVNLSLGSDYGLADDADAMAADRAVASGMVVVMSAGNAGDAYDVGGSPGNAPRGIGVAASNDGYGVFDGWRVDSPAGVLDGVRPGLRSQAYTTPGDVTAPLALPVAGDDPTACAPLAGSYAGRILVVQAAGFTCGSVTKGANARAAGAAGFLVIGDDDLLETGITGDPVVPGILVTRTDGTKAATAAASATVTVTFGDSLKDAALFTDPAQVDLLGSFSSRGTRQAGGLKPDVAAPGVTLFSAAVGTGSQGVSESGTSMASPTTAGVAALVRAAHPGWTPEEVKADLMNTAAHDVHTATGTAYGPNRQGAGRIDARAALANQVLAYADAGSGVVSASFGVVEVDRPVQVERRTITVANTSGERAGYRVRYEPVVEQPGVRYAVVPPVVVVPPGGKATVDVVMTSVRSQLRKVGDPTVALTGAAEGRQFVGEASGRVTLQPTGGKAPTLRVPVHSNAKPASTLRATAAPDGRSIALTGQGVANGTPGELTSYTSLASAFEQLGSSPQLPRCTTAAAPDCWKSELERSVDLDRVGVASDVATDPQDPYLYFGISAHGRFTSAETAVNYGVYIDATGDGRWDYQVTTYRVESLDAPLVVVTDREFELLPKGAPWIGYMNVADGRVDTNALDSDVQVLPVPLSVMPLLTPAASRIGFGVQAVSAYGTVDGVGAVSGPDGTELDAQRMSFDPLHPGLSFGSGGQPAVLLAATGRTTVDVAQDPASYAADTAVGPAPKGAMVVFSHNSTTAGRTQSVPVREQPASP